MLQKGVSMHFCRMLRSAGWLALVGLVCLLSVQPLQAQTTTATVAGTVNDAQGGIVPGATVTMTSLTQANVLTATSDAQGRFSFPIVRPDRYSIKVTMQGFKTVEKANVVVNANDRLSAGIFTLQVGEMSESISVLARVSELQSTSGERSYTLENSALTSIANNGRAMFNFANLVPGAITTSNDAGSELAQVSSFTVNGQRPNSNNMTIDGVANIDTGDNGGNMAQTNIDSVAEFKILTNSYQAEYGRAVGGQMQVVTKSGTQSFHGSGYWYGRRGSWDANSWTSNRAKTPRNEAAARNDYGYTLGGPVYIPGVFNTDKKKLFFFWSQEFQRRTDAANERVARVPTALERQGDFSQSVDNNGAPYPYIRDWTTGLPCSAADTSGCFKDGGVLGKIPASRLYQLGINALKIYPMPNTSRGGGINYFSQVPNETPINQSMLRIDFQATDKWRITGRLMRNSDTQMQAYGTTWAGSGSDRLDMPVEFVHPGRNWMVSSTGILNSTTSVEFSVGSARNSLDYSIINKNLYRTAAGLSAYPALYPDALQGDFLPDFQFDGGRTGGAGRYQTDRGPFANVNQTYDFIANLNKIWGAHTAKFGFYMQHSYKAQTNFASFNTATNFTNSTSNPYDTGFGYANAAIGVYNSFTQASKYAQPQYVYNNIEWFAQDNWKVNSKLTIDAGIRFYYMTPQWDQLKLTSTFLPDKWTASAAPRLYQPVCIGASPCSGANLRGIDPALVGQTPSTANTVESRFVGRLVPNTGNRFNGAFQAGQGVSDTMYGPNQLRLSPRFGFVYDISGNGTTILRGGYGLFYDRPQGNTVFDTINNAPGVLVSTLTWGLLTSGLSQTDPFPTLGMQPTAYDFKPPRTQSWNLGLQHKLWRQFTLDVAYVGSKNDLLLEYDQINALPAGALFKPENQDPTRAPGAIPGSTALATDLLRPYKGYNNINYWINSGYSNYHALQTGITRRFDKGLMFSVFYVFSKALGTGDSDWGQRYPYSTDAENRSANYGLTGFDRTHIFTTNFIYQTPKWFDGVTGFLLNSWQISGVYRFASGQPYTPGWGVPGWGSSNIQGGTNWTARPVQICDPGKGYSSDPYNQFNAACFVPPAVGSRGYDIARNTLRRPPLNNVDLSLSKSFVVKDRYRLEVRFDAFNALNHTQFTGVNSTVNYSAISGGTITNLPLNSSGQLVNQGGVGSISGVAQPRKIQLVTRFTF
jgi:hypothetical protein